MLCHVLRHKGWEVVAALDMTHPAQVHKQLQVFLGIFVFFFFGFVHVSSPHWVK